jgi:hypothetical protein
MMTDLAERATLGDAKSSCFSGKVNPPLDGHKIHSGRFSLWAAKAARLPLPISSLSPNPYWSSIGENKFRASASVIHPRSPSNKAPSDADNANTSTALSLRASGGTEVPKAALIVFHIPMTELYIEAPRKSLRFRSTQRCRAAMGNRR